MEDETETATIAQLDGRVVTLAAPLTHEHFASDQQDARLNGEAGLLSRNIKIIGDVSDANHARW